MSSLIFRDTFKVRADYEKLVAAFNKKLDRGFYKGYIDKDETQLFYFSGFFTRPLSPKVPFIQINFENKADSRGLTTIKFKIVNFALIFFGLVNGVFIFLSLVNLDPYRPNDISPILPVIILIFSYGFLLLMYLTELSGFRNEIGPIVD